MNTCLTTNLLLLALFLPLASWATDLAGRVVRVIDGDTVVLLDAENEQHKIRLSGIDAPESGQAYRKRAKEHLINLAAQKQIRVLSDKTDRYRRIVGKLIHDGVDLNLAMIADGFALCRRTKLRRP